jgi:hypothetical protein
LKNSFQHYFRNSAQNTALNKGGDNNKLDKWDYRSFTILDQFIEFM